MGARITGGWLHPRSRARTVARSPVHGAIALQAGEPVG
jgi:hypothetical protein